MKKHFHKSLTILFLFLFIFSLTLFRAETGISSPPSDITEHSMEVGHYPPYADRPTEYTFKFLIDKNYRANTWLEIFFPPGTDLQPPLPENKKEREERLRIIHHSILTSLNMTVNYSRSTISLPEITSLEDGRLQLRFQLSQTLGLESFLSKYRTVMICLPRRLGFYTPKESKDISYSINIVDHATVFTSSPQTLLLLPPEKDLSLYTQVEVSPSIPDTIASYHFKVHLQDVHPFQSIVSIVFPEGTSFDPPLPEKGNERWSRISKIAGYVYQANPFLRCHCGGWDCFMFMFNINAYQQQHRMNFPMLKIINPDKELWKEIEIVIPKEAGIKTPPDSETYHYQLMTWIEPYWKTSNPIQLSSQP